MSRTERLGAILLVLGTLIAPGASRAQTKLLRFPDVSGAQVAFCYAGDIWSAPASGGTAKRLTAHPGLELFPKFSPDGEWIAFTGQYEGDEQVYVMPAGGGDPVQLTYYPARGPLPARWGWDNQVYDWTPDGKSVLFRSLREAWDLTGSRLYTVPREGGLPEPLPMPVSGAGDLSPDGRRVVYSPLVRDFRTWKRYQGGWAQELYIFDLETHRTERVTDHPRADRDPMWIGERIYFSSDRNGTANLHVYDPSSGATRQLTHGETWDVRWPSDDGQARIVFEAAGELRLFDVAEERTTSISIHVPDDGLSRRPSRVSAAEQVEDFALSPAGERALFVARGDVFTVPIEHGPTRNLTSSSGAHDKWARWSPDGSRIAFVSDLDGEEEIYVVAQDGSSEPERLTDGGTAMRYAPAWSPDGRRLAFGDKNGKIWVLEIASRRLTEIADELRGQALDYVWSPDAGYLAFSLSDPNGFNSLHIWSAEDGLQRVTDEMFNEYGPAFSPDGKYLYYFSDREYAPQISSLEWNFATDRTSGIFALALRKDVEHPFPPKSDEVALDGDEKREKQKKAADEEKKEDGAGAKGEKKKEKKRVIDPMRIEFDGLAARAIRVPVPSDDYSSLTVTDEHLLYVRGDAFHYGREAPTQPALVIFSFEEREAKTLAEGVLGHAVSHDGKKVLARHDDGYRLHDVKLPAKEAAKDAAKSVSTAGLQVDRVPVEEWAQIFDEVWRRYRDFFYVENMHGYDWGALRDQYRPLLEHVAHRADLNYVIGEMIAELNVGHAYIAGGDYTVPPRPDVALPGAHFALDRDSGRYRIASILRGQNEEERYRAPLTEVGVAAQAGDYLLAIDGQEVRADDNPYRLLRYKSSNPVELTLNDRPMQEGARKVRFRPLTTERELFYLQMVETNRARVDELSGGRVGYLYIPDMGADGIREFIKQFYGQIRKEGLVVDVRGNGGGNVSQMILERLRRTLLGTRFSRNSETPGTYPSVVFHGHMACLLDEDSASDGDIFPHMFRQAGLGPLIGKRSWGGVIGITNRGPLIDGGSVFVPEFGTNAPDGSWIIEGYGVEPDIEVTNDPAAVIAGRDPQLERAVADLLAAIEAEPKRLPARPPDPLKVK